MHHATADLCPGLADVELQPCSIPRAEKAGKRVARRKAVGSELMRTPFCCLSSACKYCYIRRSRLLCIQLKGLMKWNYNYSGFSLRAEVQTSVLFAQTNIPDAMPTSQHCFHSHFRQCRIYHIRKGFLGRPSPRWRERNTRWSRGLCTKPPGTKGAESFVTRFNIRFLLITSL